MKYDELLDLPGINVDENVIDALLPTLRADEHMKRRARAHDGLDSPEAPAQKKAVLGGDHDKSDPMGTDDVGKNVLQGSDINDDWLERNQMAIRPEVGPPTGNVTDVTGANTDIIDVPDVPMHDVSGATPSPNTRTAAIEAEFDYEAEKLQDGQQRARGLL